MKKWIKNQTTITPSGGVVLTRIFHESKCPLCGNNKWTIGDHIVAPVILGNKADIRIGGPTYPQAMLICQKCGHTFYLSAIMAGISFEVPK